MELERLAGDPLDILINNTKIAKGEVIMIGERLWCSFWRNSRSRKKNGKSVVSVI